MLISLPPVAGMVAFPSALRNEEITYIEMAFRADDIAMWCAGYFFSGYINSCESPERDLFSSCDLLSCSYRSHNDRHKSSALIWNFLRVRGSISFSFNEKSEVTLLEKVALLQTSR